jgi:hypothetical protein
MSYNITALTPTATYATEANCRAAISKKLGFCAADTKLHFNIYIMWTPEGRCFPVIANIKRDEMPDVIQIALRAGINMMN